MTAEPGSTAGAVSHSDVNWNAMDWPKVHENVRRLQARIVKAEKAGRWGKVNALQHLLTHSFCGKALAVKRVTENPGKNTAGVDGVIWNTPQKRNKAVGGLKQRGYKPSALRRVYIPKKNGKKRPLSIPTMQDRAMQALYLLALDPVAETRADPVSYGFRKDRSCADAIAQCQLLLARQGSARWILEGDIAACFDRIDHAWLLKQVPMDKTILRQWLQAGFLYRQTLHPTEAGTPQGGIISPVLANLALDGLEAALREAFPRKGLQPAAHQVYLVRYADDFIITGDSREVLENEVKPLVAQFLGERGLQLSPEKTNVTCITEGFDFLGQTLRKHRRKLVVKPSKSNVTTFLRDLRALIQKNATATAGGLIAQLNPKIRGWATYHRHVCSTATFVRTDHLLFQMLWHWAVRRHPNKGQVWIRQRYFQTWGDNHWAFTGVVPGDGGTRTLRLVKASRTRVYRHIKVRNAANPYDPTWEVYFEQRLGMQIANNLQGRRLLRYLWQEQGGVCPLCQQQITKVTGWHNHHLHWRSRGGSSRVGNRVLLHPECHRRLHREGLSVSKPRPLRGVGKA